MRSTITATATAMTATKIVDDTPILHVEWFEFAPVQMTLKKKKSFGFIFVDDSRSEWGHLS